MGGTSGHLGSESDWSVFRLLSKEQEDEGCKRRQFKIRIVLRILQRAKYQRREKSIYLSAQHWCSTAPFIQRSTRRKTQQLSFIWVSGEYTVYVSLLCNRFKHLWKEYCQIRILYKVMQWSNAFRVAFILLGTLAVSQGAWQEACSVHLGEVAAVLL